jgi:hypothetical protein
LPRHHDQYCVLLLHSRTGDGQLSSFLVGLTAGSLNGAILSPLSVTKYHGWGSGPDVPFTTAAKRIYQARGFAGFYVGLHATVGRDSVFGIVYEVVRTAAKAHFGVMDLDSGGSSASNFMFDAVAAMTATLASSPFNYARNRVLATHTGERVPTIRECWRALYQESLLQEYRIAFLERRLQIGWGTLRVAFTMGLGQNLFWRVKQLCEAWF